MNPSSSGLKHGEGSLWRWICKFQVTLCPWWSPYSLWGGSESQPVFPRAILNAIVNALDRNGLSPSRVPCTPTFWEARLSLCPISTRATVSELPQADTYSPWMLGVRFARKPSLRRLSWYLLWDTNGYLIIFVPGYFKSILFVKGKWRRSVVRP